MKKFIQKSFAILMALIIILMPVSHVVYAQEATAQSTEQAPLQSMPTLQPVSEPAQPTQPDPNTVDKPTPPSEPQGVTSEVSPTPTGSPLKTISEDEYFGRVPAPTSESDVQNASTPQGSNASGNVGDTSLQTGNSANSSGITNTGNTNIAGVSGSGQGSATALNSGNGAHSTNNTSSATTNNTDTTQNNSAVIDNALDSATVTGQNSTSFNVGDSSMTTGDANTTGTIYNDVNSNLAGVSVSEFNIADDHNGDFLLDFAANCILGCTGNGLNSVANTGNGAGSTNTSDTNTTNNSNTAQTNDGVLVNDLNLLANSGNNSASFNTGGDSNITTGDANVAANVLNFMNTNVAGGNVILGVVNIFGDLVGDILLPAGFGSSCSSCATNGTTVANSGNGAHSENTASSNTTNNSSTDQFNNATIDNNLILNANTGDNKTSFNTNGNSSVTTGNTDVNAQLLNIANMNIAGGDWFLVIVNEGGKWIGKILGAPDGANFAGTSGTEFAVDENGQITATNSGNGAGSTNTANTNTTNNTSVDQTNNASIVNNINLDANTGGNSSSYNTGGTSDIITGDATVIANLVNFVNNNITGGRLVVTVVNVFGSWAGDFVSPGQTQREKLANTTQKSEDQKTNTQSNGRGSSQTQTDDLSETQTETNDQTVDSQTSDSTPNVRGTQVSVQSGDVTAYANSKTEGNGTVAVLGENITAEETMNKAIKVNLAWVVVLLPTLIVLGTGGFVIRRKVLSHKQ